MRNASDQIGYNEPFAITEMFKTANPLYLSMLGIITAITNYLEEHPGTVVTFVIALTSVVLYRCIIKVCSTGRGRSDSFLHGCITFLYRYAPVAVWSVFTVTTLNLYGLAWPGLLILLITSGIATGATLMSGARRPVSWGYVVILLTPMAIWSFSQNDYRHITLSMFVMAYIVVLIKGIKDYNTWNQTNKMTLELLNNRTTELVTINNELQNEIKYRRSTEKALRKSEERYRILFQNNPIETIIVDHNARITVYNSAKARSKGRVPEINEIMYRDYGGKHENNMYEELMDSIKTGKQKEFPEQKYNDRYLHIKISPFSGGAIITSIDITKRKHAEERIQTLTRDILRVQENERKRIARDLHDSVAQDLSSLRISCETFFDDIKDESFQVRKRINEISKVLQGSIQAVRDIAYELRPPSLDEFGLAVTLYRYCEDFGTKTGLDVDFFAAGIETVRFNSDTEINLYRLVQEALNNIRKHAMATKVKIRLVASYPNIILRVDDNGIGFDATLQASLGTKNKHMGLRSMEERASLMEGRIKIQSSPGEGTSVVAKVPVMFKPVSVKTPDVSIAATH